MRAKSWYERLHVEVVVQIVGIPTGCTLRGLASAIAYT